MRGSSDTQRVMPVTGRRRADHATTAVLAGSPRSTGHRSLEASLARWSGLSGGQSGGNEHERGRSRPLITSAICAALESLREASIEVEPDDVEGYRDAIVRLSDDAALYDRPQCACGPLQEQFYDRENSWYTAMCRAIERHVPRRGGADGDRTHGVTA